MRNILEGKLAYVVSTVERLRNMSVIYTAFAFTVLPPALTSQRLPGRQTPVLLINTTEKCKDKEMLSKRDFGEKGLFLKNLKT